MTFPRLHVLLIALLLTGSMAVAQRNPVRNNLLLNEASVLLACGDTLKALTFYDRAFAHVPWGLWELSEAA